MNRTRVPSPFFLTRLVGVVVMRDLQKKIQEAMERGENEGDLPPVTVVGRSVFDLPMDAVV